MPGDALAASAGSLWVHRYLVPLLRARAAALPPPLACLQLWADDDDEASALRRLGHRCTVFMPRGAALEGVRWRAAPVVGDAAARLPFDDGAFDFVFSGAFARLAHGTHARVALARELCRVVRPGGAILLCIGNRYCPVDIHSREALLHGPWHPEKMSLAEVEAAFAPAAPARIERLSLDGQFGWARARGPLRLAVGLAARALHVVSDPRRRAIYASPLNPVLMLCLTR